MGDEGVGGKTVAKMGGYIVTSSEVVLLQLIGSEQALSVVVFEDGRAHL